MAREDNDGRPWLISLWLGVGLEWGFLNVARGLCGLNLHLHQRREHPGFPIKLLRCGAGGDEGRVKLKRCQQSDIKTWTQTQRYLEVTFELGGISREVEKSLNRTELAAGPNINNSSNTSSMNNHWI